MRTRGHGYCFLTGRLDYLIGLLTVDTKLSWLHTMLQDVYIIQNLSQSLQVTTGRRSFSHQFPRQHNTAVWPCVCDEHSVFCWVPHPFPAAPSGDQPAPGRWQRYW